MKTIKVRRMVLPLCQGCIDGRSNCDVPRCALYFYADYDTPIPGDLIQDFDAAIEDEMAGLQTGMSQVFEMLQQKRSTS